MITPYPRTSTPYRREEEEEYEEEPIQTPEEVYENTETEEPDRVEVASPTGDNIELNAYPEERIQPQRDSIDKVRNDAFSQSDRNEAVETVLEANLSDDERDNLMEEVAESNQFTDYEPEKPSSKTELEREWFNWRLETADTPNVIAGINKASAFKNGWSPERWRQFVNKYQIEKQRKQRISSNSRSRNGFEIGWRPPQRQAAPVKAARYNLGDNIAGGIERGYDLLGLNCGMAGAMAYDQYTQQSISDSVFGNLPTQRGGNSYDPIGIGFAGGGGGGEIIFGGFTGGGSNKRSASRTLKAASTSDLVFGSLSAPARRPAGRKTAAKPKKPATKPKTAAGRPTASKKRKPVSKIKKSAAKTAPIKKRAVKSTPAKKTHVPAKKSAPVRKAAPKRSTPKKSVGGRRK